MLTSTSAQTAIGLGQTVPEFSFISTDNNLNTSAQLQGKNIILFFYPKDNTPGCTIEAQAFRDTHAQFEKFNTVIIGVSRDNLKSHENFKCKYELPFILASDADEKLCSLFNVIKLKNKYGKMVRGIERSTFLIDKNRVLRKEWRSVKVEGHVDAVLTAVKELT